MAAPALPALAQADYPTKPVRLIVAFPPGGSTDIIARLVGQKLSERLGQQVIIDNRGGAGGTIGTEIAARSTPDGYTLTMGTTSTHVIAPAAYAKLKYDPIKDFAPITLVASTPYLLVLNPSVKANTLKEFVALAKSQPGKLNYASAGTGSTTHLAMEMLKSAAGIDIVHVPYNGNGPAGTAVLGGQVQALFGSMPAVLPQAKAGKVRPIAVGTREALAGAARRADRRRIGLSRVSKCRCGSASSRRKGTPVAIVNRLHSELVKIALSPEMKEQFERNGAEPAHNATLARARAPGPKPRSPSTRKSSRRRTSSSTEAGRQRQERRSRGKPWFPSFDCRGLPQA